MLEESEPFKTIISLAKFLGIWPSTFGLQRKLAMAFVLFCMITLCIILKIAEFWRVKNIDEFNEIAFILPSLVISNIKAINYVIKERKILELIEKLNKKTEKYPELADFHRISYRKMKILSWLQIAFLTAAVTGVPIESVSKKKLLSRMWMPDSWRATEGGFWAYWTLECTSAFYCCTINTVMDLLPTFLLILIDDFIKMYAETLKKLDWKEMNKEKIREVCETHREIKEICIDL
jgi:hypothetical protein